MTYSRNIDAKLYFASCPGEDFGFKIFVSLLPNAKAKRIAKALDTFSSIKFLIKQILQMPNLSAK